MKTHETAIFAGGCFWCTEAVFKMLRGIISVMPGYTGGHVPHPTYEQVSSGETGHAEAIKIEFDPSHVSYQTLLTIFFATHDPTTVNRQGNDVGTQYRSGIFYTTEDQKREAEAMIAGINASNEHGAPVVTEVLPAVPFYEAEEYHRDYYARNRGAGYCQVVINPKLEKVQKQFADLLADIYKK